MECCGVVIFVIQRAVKRIELMGLPLMKTTSQRFCALTLALLLAACNFPRAQPPTLTPFRAEAGATLTSTPTSTSSAPCAFVEGRQQLPELSGQFLSSL